MAKVLFIHTLASLIDTFNEVASRQMPSVERTHILDEPLLERIRNRGTLSVTDTRRVQRHVDLAEETRANAVLVTCSNLSPCVDKVLAPAGIPVLKIDAAMIDEAVERASSLAVLATNPATMGPTTQAIRARAAQAGKEITIEEVLLLEAFEAIREGDLSKHDEIVKKATVECLLKVEFVLLAQASMARVLDVLDAEDRTRVLTSPEAAVARLRELLLQ